MYRTGPLGEVAISQTVRLRLTLLIRDLFTEGRGELVVPVTAAREITVCFRRPNEGELAEAADEARLSLGDTMCEVGGIWSVSSANQEAFAKLAKDGVGELTETVVVFGPAPGKTGMPAWDSLPSGVQSLLDGALSELARTAGRVFRCMRWMLGLRGEHNSLRQWRFSWSPDGAQWQDLPWRAPIQYAKFATTLTPSEHIAQDIARAVADAKDEPVAHEMLREALDEADESPRSAIVIGMAAAEVALKEFISLRVPEAAWLVAQAPTPPLINMLTQFLPSLLSEAQRKFGLRFVDGKDKNRDYLDPVLRDLNRGISMRNLLVHKSAGAPDPEKVKPILAAVEDLLWLLDYYAGCEFAWTRIRPHVRSAWSAAAGTL